MSHPEQMQFVKSVKTRHPAFFRGVRVLEIGSRNVNGSVRPLFEDCRYVGIDPIPGKGVDVVAFAHEYEAAAGSFDVVISCEAFEHDPHLAKTVDKAMELLRPGGLFVATWAGPNRAEHGANGQDVTSGEHYHNVTGAEFRLIVGDRLESFSVDMRRGGQDVYAVGVRAGVPTPIPSADRRRLHVFLHVATMNHYAEILAELSGMILGSGLYDEAATLTACVVRATTIPMELFKGPVSPLLVEPAPPIYLPSKWQVVDSNQCTRAFEYPTLERLHAQAKQDPESFILYVHTKGASQPKPNRRKQRDSWRRYMAHFAIARWRECVEMLESGSDLVGVDLHGMKMGDPHYCGNFWWGRAAHLATLPAPKPTTAFGRTSTRYGAETWPCSKPGVWSENFTIGEEFHWGTATLPEKWYRSMVGEK